METSRWPQRILSKPPSIASTSLSELHENYVIPEILDTKPVYQRGRYRHNEIFVIELLTEIMKFGVVLPILLYKLQECDNKRSKQHKWEVVDGVHRITTISCYMNGRYIECEKNKKIMPYIFNEKTKEYVLYTKTKDTEDWRCFPENSKKNIVYMSDEDKRLFNSFEIIFYKITCPLTVDQRREIFVSIQNSLIITNNDLYKNYIRIDIVKIISDYNLDTLFENVCIHLDKDITQYTTQWIIRFWLISIEHTFSPIKVLKRDKVLNHDKKYSPIEVFDSDIKTMLENRSSCIAVINENDMNTFVKDFKRYCNFFETLDANITLSPVAIYAIYDVLRKNQDIEYEDKLRTHLIKLSNNETKAQRSMWETRVINSDTGKKYSADETRNKLYKYFQEFTEKLLNINDFEDEEPIKVAAPRKPIPAKVRAVVWKNHFNDDDIGKCFCCNTDIYKKAKDRKKTWNCGHIVSHYNGGEDTVNNMKCICFGCNQAMKTTNLLE
jgi:hypothetical protein